MDFEFHASCSRAGTADYAELFSASFNGDKKLSPEYLRWLYEDNPHGKVIGVDAFAGGRLAAHYAIIPRHYKFQSREFLAALSVNTATHPDFQGKGLFTKLAQRTYENAADKGVKFVIGAANANSIHGFLKKLGFTELGQSRLYIGNALTPQSDGELGLSVDAGWLKWRLRNPARQYLHAKFKGKISVYSKIGMNIFNIGCLPGEHAATVESQCPRRSAAQSMMPVLSPYFGPTKMRSPSIPLKLQPSPWHIIWRQLDNSLPTDLAQRLVFDGLAMDTF